MWSPPSTTHLQLLLLLQLNLSPPLIDVQLRDTSGLFHLCRHYVFHFQYAIHPLHTFLHSPSPCGPPSPMGECVAVCGCLTTPSTYQSATLLYIIIIYLEYLVYSFLYRSRHITQSCPPSHHSIDRPTDRSFFAITHGDFFHFPSSSHDSLEPPPTFVNEWWSLHCTTTHCYIRSQEHRVSGRLLYS